MYTYVLANKNSCRVELGTKQILKPSSFVKQFNGLQGHVRPGRTSITRCFCLEKSSNNLNNFRLQVKWGLIGKFAENIENKNDLRFSVGDFRAMCHSDF